MIVISANTCGQYDTVTVDTRYTLYHCINRYNKKYRSPYKPIKGKEYVLPNLPDAPLFRTRGMNPYCYVFSSGITVSG